VTKRQGRTQACDAAQARTRLAQARKFLEVAQLSASEDFDESLSVAAALAVLAGVAASDAACCGALGRRARGDDHRDAATLLARIRPGGEQAAKALLSLIDLKDTAHYGLIHVSRRQLTVVMRRASTLVAFADDVLRG
jgi:hypothetical protein